MDGFTDSLRGYGSPVYTRDGFKCRYCGLDGTLSFANWLSLSVDHLLPPGHPKRDKEEYVVTACKFCNTADNRYFDLGEERGLRFGGTPDELVAQRLPYVKKTRADYQEFWEERVRPQRKCRDFFEVAHVLLEEIADTQADAIRRATELVAESLMNDGVWHVFGTGHSHFIGEEVYFRAGGLIPVNAILFPALMQHEGPVTSTRLERLPGLARIVLEKEDIRPGDVLAIASNSGKNAVPVEMALCAKDKGLRTIAITSLNQSRAAEYGAGLDKKLFEICDVVIDNCGSAGDAALEIPGTDLATAATSSLVGIAVMEQIVYGVTCRFAEAGLEPPIFKTANLPGGDAWNARMIAQYGARVRLR